ncbi:MAG TPA: DUF1206 domain-containing protein [Propionibacteriaceae bacterium]|nr:DUF1206 domain-containing protein [Propionibacteriaceae bacterium]
MSVDVAQVRRSRSYHGLIGVGLVSYGLVHLVLAWLALQIAFGGREDASAGGALQQLTRQPLGTVLLWVMAIGLFTLVLWQALEATIGREAPGRDGRLRKRLSSAGRAVVYLALGILAVGVAMGDGGGSGNGEQTLSTRLMALPFGRLLVGAVGVAVIAVGISQIVKGVKQKFTEDLDSGVGQFVRRLGTAGYCAKGVALAIIGGLFGYAALTYDPEKAGGLDAALSTVRSQPFGTVLLVVMALGIACFGVFCFVWARKARY